MVSDFMKSTEKLLAVVSDEVAWTEWRKHRRSIRQYAANAPIRSSGFAVPLSTEHFLSATHVIATRSAKPHAI
jgi:hypothetical protein